jgi:hypothetical protein
LNGGAELRRALEEVLVLADQKASQRGRKLVVDEESYEASRTGWSA